MRLKQEGQCEKEEGREEEPLELALIIYCDFFVDVGFVTIPERLSPRTGSFISSLVVLKAGITRHRKQSRMLFSHRGLKYCVIEVAGRLISVSKM